MTTKTTVDLDYQLLKLDHALFRLLDTRAQIIAEGPRSADVAQDHILAHHSGSLTANQIKAVCETLDAVFAEHDLKRG